MNQLLQITKLIIFFLFCYHINAGDQPEQILTVGVFHGDEVSAVDGEEWNVLYSKNNRFFLNKTTIQLSLVEDPIMDDLGKKTGKKVSLNLDGQPILLLRNISNIIIGEVTTNINNKIQFLNEDSIRAKTKNNEYIISMHISNSKAQLLFSDGKINQILGEYSAFSINDSTYYFGDDASPSLIWAGDLDRDNKLDLIMDLTDHYNVSEVTLFLSSYAIKGNLLKKVAVFRTVGC